VLPFAARGVSSWPAVERALARALSKAPADRFPSVGAFATALRQAELPEPTRARGGVDLANAQALLDRMMRRVAVCDGKAPALEPPTCSVTYGAAGIAYALYRMACIRSDPALLSLADVWCTSARQEEDPGRAFCNAGLGLGPETIGQVSPYHTEAGIHCVQALISHAMGDVVSQQHAIEAFSSASEAPRQDMDLTLGRSGTLVACSLLLDLDRGHEGLRALGRRTMEAIWADIDPGGPIAENVKVRYLGIAHGWAGILYATLRWSQAAAEVPPASVGERLGQLAACAESRGRGLRWRRTVRRHHADYVAGWCNGSSGFIHLWGLAHQVFPNAGYLTLAEQAAWDAWDARDQIRNLCCGLAGRAYGLLCLYRHTGQRAWLARARELAEMAATGVERGFSPDSLYKGEVGVALLASDLTRPEESCLPFFEPEGWP
jgi:serine/threonine-protein kinase